MGTQIWIRNPKLCIREVVAAGAKRTSWDEGYLKKTRTDAQKYLKLHYPPDFDWEAMIIGWSGALIVDADHGINNPREIHTVWSATEHHDRELEHFAKKIEEEGYKSMLVVTDIPNVTSLRGKEVIAKLHEMQEYYPDLRIFFHGSYSFPAIFGNDWYAADYEPRETARRYKVMLPNGKEVDVKQDRELLSEMRQWVNLLGFRVSELTEPRDRCIYNIHSAMWASKHWEENFRFKTRKERYDIDVPDSEFKPPETNLYKRVRHTFDDYDKLLCNTCSVQKSCKFFRLGSVCSVPGAEPTKLAEMFNTRDADRIIRGLGTVLAAQANRAEDAMTDEAMTGELSPEVTKILNSLFNNGVKLAKLVNPELNGKGVQVGIQLNGSGAAHIAASSSASQMTAAIVATLEAKGIPREDITPSMIATVLDEVDSESDLLELDMSKDDS